MFNRILTTLFALVSISAAMNSPSKRTIFVTTTEYFTVTPTAAPPVMSELDAQQWQGDWILVPTPSAPVPAWTPEAQSSWVQPQWTAPTSTTTAMSTETPGIKPDKGKVGLVIFAGIFDAFIGISLLGCTFFCYKQRKWCFGYRLKKRPKSTSPSTNSEPDVEAALSSREMPATPPPAFMIPKKPVGSGLSPRPTANPVAPLTKDDPQMPNHAMEIQTHPVLLALNERYGNDFQPTGEMYQPRADPDGG